MNTWIKTYINTQTLIFKNKQTKTCKRHIHDQRHVRHCGKYISYMFISCSYKTKTRSSNKAHHTITIRTATVKNPFVK